MAETHGEGKPLRQCKPQVIVNVYWNGGKPFLRPVDPTISQKEEVQWKVGSGDNASDFIINFDDWPFAGSQETIRKANACRKTKKKGNFDYTCSVVGPNGEVVAIGPRPLFPPEDRDH